MAETNKTNIFEIFSLTHATQNPLYLLAEAAFISENTNKLTQHEISSYYSNCSTNCTNYSQEIFTEKSSHYSTNPTFNIKDDDTELKFFEQKKIDIGHKTISEINNLTDDCSNSDLSSPTLSCNSTDLAHHSGSSTLTDDSFSTNIHHYSDSENSICSKQDNNHKVKINLKNDKEQVPIFEHNNVSVVDKNKGIKKPVRLSSSKNNSNVSRKIITKDRKMEGNHDKKRKRKNYGYTTRSNRISRPPSALSGGRWAGS